MAGSGFIEIVIWALVTTYMGILGVFTASVSAIFTSRRYAGLNPVPSPMPSRCGKLLAALTEKSRGFVRSGAIAVAGAPRDPQLQTRRALPRAISGMTILSISLETGGRLGAHVGWRGHGIAHPERLLLRSVPILGSLVASLALATWIAAAAELPAQRPLDPAEPPVFGISQISPRVATQGDAVNVTVYRSALVGQSSEQSILLLINGKPDTTVQVAYYIDYSTQKYFGKLKLQLPFSAIGKVELQAVDVDTGDESAVEIITVIEAPLWSRIGLLIRTYSAWFAIAAILVFMVPAAGYFGFRRWRRTALLRENLATERAKADLAAERARLNDPNFRNVEVVLAEREAVEKSLFETNIKDAFEVRELRWQNVSLFEDGYYDFAPRVNVLLGRNGFGKTLLLRTLVAMLQYNAQYSTISFPKDHGLERPPLLRLTVRRNGEPEDTLRDSTYFKSPPEQQPVGKIPVMAIPDSRFLDRRRVTVSGAAMNAEGLAAGGARNFLTQEPFVNMIEDFLTGLCLDYGSIRRSGNPRRRFEHGIFKLVEEVVAELTGDRMFQFAEINRVERTRFEILVRTTDSQDLIPIQTASQGTLSVIAIFGLIHSFLHSLRPEEAEDKVSLVPAIVVIDEIDAHLHPSWQQKILGMLTKRFPNVQFIISAHSPLIVAGCDQGEVSVLRRREGSGRFYVDPLPGDFLGAKAADLYTRVFDIEETDRLYVEYSAKTPKDLETSKLEISQLRGLEALSAEQEEMLSASLREQRLITRAEEVRAQRVEALRADGRLKKVEAERDRARYELLEKNREIELLQAGLAQLKANDAGASGEGPRGVP